MERRRTKVIPINIRNSKYFSYNVLGCYPLSFSDVISDVNNVLVTERRSNGC